MIIISTRWPQSAAGELDYAEFRIANDRLFIKNDRTFIRNAKFCIILHYKTMDSLY